MTGSSNCTIADFDTTVGFENGPAAFAITYYKRNISKHPCVFDGPIYGPSIVPDRVEGEKPFSLCYDCENRLPNGTYIVFPKNLTLDPGQVAQQTYRWKTKPSASNLHCVQPKWMGSPVLLVTPSLLKPVCSDIQVGRFTLAGDAPDDGIANADDELTLTSENSTYYLDETFGLRVLMKSNGASPALGNDVCPTFYLRQRSPDGSTRIDEVHPLASAACGTHPFGHELGDWQRGFELDSGMSSRWTGMGDHEFQVFELTSPPDAAQPRFASSNVLHIRISDPASIQRHWGPRVAGIATDLTLEKQSYRLGEDVPLHIAIADFSAPVPLYTWDPLWDPCMTVGVQVRDSMGKIVTDSDRYPSPTMCMGHGFGPRPFAKGKVVPIERTLSGLGWLPNHPGTYTLVVTWAPCAGPDPSTNSSDGRPHDLKPYAVVQATATIHIAPEQTNLP